MPTVTIVVGSAAPISVPWTQNMNVQDALESAYNVIQNSADFSFAIQFFGTFQGSPLGYMVIMMNGDYDLPGTGEYWALLVNGIYASKGIDYTVLNPGDTVSFINEPYADTKHQNTAVAIKHWHYVSLKIKAETAARTQ